MRKIYKIEEKLTSEGAELRQPVAELEAPAAERKRMEEAMRESEEFSSSLLANSPTPISVINPDTSLRYVNPALENLTGFSARELTGRKAPYPYWTQETFRETSRDFNKALLHGAERVERLFQKKTGERFWVEITCTRVISNGEFKYLLANWVNITERKKAEQALRESQEQLKRMFDSVTDGIVLTALDGTILKVNQRAAQVHGFASPDEMIGKSALTLSAPRDQEKLARAIGKALKQGTFRGIECTLLRSDAAEFPAELSTSVLKDASGEVIGHIAIVRDITGRKQAEEALRESQEFSSGLLESSPNPILVLNPDTSIRYVNPALEKLTGFSAREITGRKAPYPWWPDEYKEEMLAGLKEAMATSGRRSERILQKKNGERFQVVHNSAPVMHQGKQIYFLVNWVDITERKQVEERERELQRELYLASRLVAIGELAAGIAHQLNNPLTGVLGFSQRLLRKSTDPEASQDLKRIYAEAERAAKVVQNLLTFARRRQTRKQNSDINEILESALELRDYELKTSNIEVVTDLAPNLPGIMLDFYQIEEVFLNIILNAEQAMTEAHTGSRLAIKTEEKKGYIRITFNDNGPGIPVEKLYKIFDPFFTTRGEKGGTGLGLSVCHGIITEHGGKIYAKSKPGKGATFFVELPLLTS